MIKAKTAFTIFFILTIIVFPYYILIINTDFLSSIIPGWNTSIIPIRIIANLIKFIILSVVSFYYYKLSKNSIRIEAKKFIIHLLLTFPAVLVSKFNVYQFIELYFHHPDIFLYQIQMVIFINIIINMLFFSGQILFGIYYYRSRKNNTILAIDKHLN